LDSLAFLVPGDLASATGGYAYDREIVRGLRARGWDVQVRALDESFPRPTAPALAHARRVLADLPDNSLVLIDGLALGVMPDLVAAEQGRLRQIALIHHPLAAETGLGPTEVEAFQGSERRALAVVAGILVTSRGTRNTLVEIGIDPARIAVVEPGTAPAPLARGSGTATINLLCVGSLIPRKGHAILLEALSRLRDRPWHLVCAGSAERNPQTADALRRQLANLGLGERVRLAGEVDEATLHRLYDQADLFVLPTWLEGYGMAVAEAIARGIPVISTPTGGIAEIVGAGGLLASPGDSKVLAIQLARLLDDTGLRRCLVAAARLARTRLPTWEQASDRMARVLRTLAQD
jgi:glycosyltransferase involved in cell wall biosynthesis